MRKTQPNKAIIIMVGILGGIFFLLLLSTVVSVAKAGPSSSAPRIYMTLTGTPPKPWTSLALNKPVKSSAPSCKPEEGPEKAVNGTWYGTFWNGNWYGDNWCSNAETKWIQIDLGQNYSITRIVIYHAGGAISPSGDPYTTRDYSIYGIKATTGLSQLKTIVSVTNNTQGTNSFFFTPSTAPIARHIRITVRNGAQPGQENIARIYDVLIDGTPVP